MHPQRQDDVFFESIHDKKIFCLSSEPENPSAKVVIMCHGFKGSSTGPARQFVTFSRLLVERGYTVLRFDQPNCGNSEGSFIDVSFDDWVNTIVEIVENYIAQGYAIGLLGESMGASAAMVASSRERVRGKVSAILLWSPDPITTFDGDPAVVHEESGQKYRQQFWQEARDADILGSMLEFEGGIHLVYGEHDDVVGPEMSKVADLVREKRGTILRLDGEGHSRWREDTARMVFEQEVEKLEEWMP